jgi:hypothetical protein
LWALINAVMNLRVPKNVGSLAENLLASQEGLCSVKLVSYAAVMIIIATIIIQLISFMC